LKKEDIFLEQELRSIDYRWV